MMKEDMKYIAIKGIFLGLILFASAVIEMLISKNMEHFKILRPYLIPLLLGYCLLGMLIRWIGCRRSIKKEGFHLFSGVAVVYWIWIITTAFMVCAFFIPEIIRHIVLVNIVTLLLLWYADYLYLKKVAKELNSSLLYFGRTLVEDLPSPPQSEDKFMEEIQNYCSKNNLSMEIIEYGIPAKVKMDNTLYTVKLGQYYSMVGTVVYTLEFHKLVSE